MKGQSVGTLTGQMAKVQISDEGFPRRPAFGNQGKAVTLWANYFKLVASAEVAMLKYSLDAKRIDKHPRKEEGKSPKKEGKASKSKEEDKKNGPKGRKLHSIIKSALDQVAAVPFATEFKDQVISLKPFSLPEGKIVKVQYRDEGKDDEYEVTFNGPTTVDLPGLMRYLTTMTDPSGDTSFPKFEGVIDAISIITGFHARSNPAASSLGRSRYFPLNPPETEHYNLGQPEFNRIIRGYFQSARPATGRIILNANVAHGVFRLKGLVSELADGPFRGQAQFLHKAILRLRCRCKILSDDKDPKKVRFIQKIICGLALVGDGDTKDRNKPGNKKDGPKPKVKQPGANATDVEFYLRSPAPAGLRADAFCSVEEYYKKSKRYYLTIFLGSSKLTMSRIWVQCPPRTSRGERWY